MSDASTEELLVRALKHERALIYGAATDVVETHFGSIVLNTDHLNALSHNFAFVDRRVEPGHQPCRRLNSGGRQICSWPCLIHPNDSQVLRQSL